MTAARAAAALLLAAALTALTGCGPERTMQPRTPIDQPTGVQVTQAPPAVVPSAVTGRTCRDGTVSHATGRGACSHHGGVA